MPNRWGDDYLVEEVARDYVNRFGTAAVETVEAEYASAAERRDAIGSEASADIRDAISRLAK